MPSLKQCILGITTDVIVVVILSAVPIDGSLRVELLKAFAIPR